MTIDEAALVEPVSVPLHAIYKIGGGLAPYDRVAVFGGGPIGMLAVVICKSLGAPVIMVEPMPFRAEMAKRLGADRVVDPTQVDAGAEIQKFYNGKGATLILECSGSNGGIASAMDCMALGARVVLIGHSRGRKVPAEVGMLIWQDAYIGGSKASPYFIPKALDAMSRKIFDPTAVVTHRFKLDDIETALKLGHEASECGKILIYPS